MGLFSSIFDPGKGARSRGKKLAAQAEFTGGTFTGPGGLMAGLSFGPNGQVQATGSLGGLDPLFQQMLSQASAGGIPGELQEDYEGFGTAFRQALGQVSQDPLAFGQMITDKLRPGLDRAQGNLRNETFSKLFGAGQAAISGAASPVVEGLQQQFAEQQQQLDVAGIDMGRQMQQDAFNRMLGAGQSRAGIFEQGQGGQQQAFQNAMFLSTLPMQLQAGITSAGGLRTDSLLGQASSFMNASSLAKSPLLEGLTAAGGFMTGLGALRKK